jgi:hypothetical protein
MAPRVQPKVSARMGRKTPYAARGVEMPRLTAKSAATISQRREAEGRARA